MRRLTLLAVAVAVAFLGSAAGVSLLLSPASAERPLGPAVVVGATTSPSMNLSTSGSTSAAQVAASAAGAAAGEPGEGSNAEEAHDAQDAQDADDAPGDVQTVSPRPAESVDDEGSGDG